MHLYEFFLISILVIQIIILLVLLLKKPVVPRSNVGRPKGSKNKTRIVFQEQNISNTHNDDFPPISQTYIGIKNPSTTEKSSVELLREDLINEHGEDLEMVGYEDFFPQSMRKPK